MGGLIILGVSFLSSCVEKKSATSGPISKIVSFSPNITEILYALHQEDRLLAVTDFCSYPPQARHKERIGGLLNPNMEKLLRIQPDLLLGTPAIRDLADKVNTHGIRTVMLANDTMQDIFNSIDSIGTLLNCRQQADSLRRAIGDSLQKYQDLSAALSSDRPAAMLVIGRDQGTTQNITVSGRETFLSSLWTMAGGQNLFDDLPGRYAQASREAILTRGPQLVVEFRFNETLTPERVNEVRQEWNDLAGIPAIDNQNIFLLNGDYTLIPGPRIYLLLRDYYNIRKDYHSKSLKK